MAFMLCGGHGVISVTANVAPKLMSELCRAALAGDCLGARAINDQLQGLHKQLFIEANPIPVKWAMERMGIFLWHPSAADPPVRGCQPVVEAAMRQAQAL